ncbi:hypothetical protein [Paenibacillus spongiae]|uniref:DNA-directed DNA polymerase n=1 Tax=Paenibacillus spongiae TaxID=2909671 RepID=A0ABY5S5R6_9BACL|nr:hypothetical protein [Paenibacillus spongiae]UVI29044.1 hypothetical protein L1F29_26960 [Paenibacillus spongiae]
MPNQQNHEDDPIRISCYNAARQRYGDDVPEAVISRLEEELQHIVRNGFSDPYIVAARIVDKANADGFTMAIRGSVGSSIVAYLLGITEVNPLPPHYQCLECRHVEWAADAVDSGFDLPSELCAKCGGKFVGDGHRIPYQTFFGADGNTSPNIDLYTAWEYEEHANNELNYQMHNSIWRSGIPVPDIIPHNAASVLKRVHTLTGIDPRSIPMNDPKALSLFRSTDAIGVTPDQIKSKVATYGIPEMGIGPVRDMLQMTQPSSFSELVQISGLSHGVGTWDGNARERIQEGAGTLRTSIACRDQLMMDLMKFGVDMETAYSITVSKRKDLPIAESVEAMLESKVPAWYMESYRKVRYLFPKSHAVSYVISAVRYAFYKLHFPMEFYAAYFSVHGIDVDMELCTRGERDIRNSPEEVRPEGYHTLQGMAPEKALQEMALELALEMNARGMRIRKSSHAGGRYVVESELYGTLEIPFIARQQSHRVI